MKGKGTNFKIRKYLLTPFILIFAALFLTWLLEYRYFLNSAADAWNFVFGHTKIYFYNALIMLTIICIFYGFIRKLFTTIAISTNIVLIIGYINIAKFNFRGMPLLPEDFSLGSQVGTLTKFIDMGQVLRLIIAVILVFVLGLILDKLSKNIFTTDKNLNDKKWWKKYRLISRTIIIALSICCFLISTGFIRHHGKEREVALPILSSKFVDWNQEINYSENGFLIGFLYNTSILKIESPENYSRQKISEINKSLSEQKADDDKNRISIVDSDYNIIIVQNESFFDPSILYEYYPYTGGDVTPNLHNLEKKYSSGYMFSTDYGGGTANIEFEILTGLTNYWLSTTPYTNLITYQNSVPSLASYMSNSGIYTSAIHPFVAGMYKRDEVLPRLGFKEFIAIQDFDIVEREGSSEYINDRTAYNKTIERMKQTDEKDFISLVTMQNHAPYNTDEYGESSFKITSDLEQDKKDMIETYLMSLHKSDEYLVEFLNSLDNFNEKTIVLFYGDHAPGIFSDVLENDDEEISNLVRMTPYMIYSNFEDEKINLPTTTPSCLPNLLLNHFNLQKPSNFYLLDTICKTTPILSDYYFRDTAPVYTSELENYNLLTYDLVAGKQYSLK